MNNDLVQKIVALAQGGASMRRIARSLGVSRRTVKKALGQVEHARGVGPPEASLRAAVTRGSRLDAYEPAIAELLARYPGITAQRVHEELRRLGYAGGYTISTQARRRGAHAQRGHDAERRLRSLRPAWNRSRGDRSIGNRPLRSGLRGATAVIQLPGSGRHSPGDQPQDGRARLWDDGDRPKNAVRIASQPGGEEEGVRRTRGRTVTEAQGPKIGLGKRLTRVERQRALPIPIRQTLGINLRKAGGVCVVVSDE
jgi:transposase